MPTLASLLVKIGGDTSGLSASTRRAGRDLQRAARKLESTGRSLSLTVTAPLVLLGVTIARTAASFSDSMNEVAAVSGATGAAFGRLEAQARNLGATTRFTASQAAEGMAFLSRAGFEATETLQAMPAVLALSAAGAVDLGLAAEITSDIVRGFGLRAAEATRVADVLALASASSSTTVEQLGEAMKFVAPVARSLGITLEETAAMVGTLSDSGVKATMAGTGMRRALLSLAKPTAESSKVFKTLGVSINDAAGEMRPLPEILDDLTEAGASTSEMMAIFGTRGFGIANILKEKTAPAIGVYTEKLEEAEGTSKRMAEIMERGLGGSLRKLKSAFEALQISIAKAGLEERVTGLADSLTSMSRSLAGLNPRVLDFGVKMATVAAITGPLLIVIGKIAAAFATVSASVVAFAVGAAALNVWLSKLLGVDLPNWLLKTQLGIDALDFAPLTRQVEDFEKVVKKQGKVLGDWVDDTADYVREQAAANDEAKKGVRVLQDLSGSMSGAGDAADGLSSSIEKVKERFRLFDFELEEVQSSLPPVISILNTLSGRALPPVISELNSARAAVDALAVALPKIPRVLNPVVIGMQDMEEMTRRAKQQLDVFVGVTGKDIPASTKETKKALIDVSTITTDLSRDLAGLIVEGGSVTDMFKSMAKAIIRDLIEGALKTLMDTIKDLLKNLLPKLSSKLAGVFGGGTSNVTTSFPFLGGGGGGGGGGFGTSTASLVLQGIALNKQFQMEATLNAIELNTRTTAIAIGGSTVTGSGGLGMRDTLFVIASRLEFVTPNLDEIKSTLWDIRGLLENGIPLAKEVEEGVKAAAPDIGQQVGDRVARVFDPGTAASRARFRAVLPLDPRTGRGRIPGTFPEPSLALPTVGQTLPGRGRAGRPPLTGPRAFLGGLSGRGRFGEALPVRIEEIDAPEAKDPWAATREFGRLVQEQAALTRLGEGLKGELLLSMIASNDRRDTILDDVRAILRVIRDTPREDVILTIDREELARATFGGAESMGSLN